jgi:hypothetical protein
MAVQAGFVAVFCGFLVMFRGFFVFSVFGRPVFLFFPAMAGAVAAGEFIHGGNSDAEGKFGVGRRELHMQSG